MSDWVTYFTTLALYGVGAFFVVVIGIIAVAGFMAAWEYWRHDR